MNKYVVTLLLSLISLVDLGAATLTVGTNAEFAPFTFREKGEIVGFDIDVAKEVAERLGKEIKFKDMPFDALIPDVIMGNVDFVACGMSYTAERAKRVAFTKTYMTEDPFVIMTLASQDIPSVEKLKGKKIVVNEGFTADLYLSDMPGMNLTRLPNTTDAFLALTSKRADAFVTAKSTADMFLGTQDASLYNATVIPETGETCALVVSKKFPQLLVDIQKALDAMEADGTLTQLRTKWKLK